MINSDIKRLLIFRPGHLGDTIVALPAVWNLKQNLPETEFSYLYNVDRGNPHYITPGDVLDKTGLIDRWFEYPFFEGQGVFSKGFSRAALLLKLRRSRFDTLAYLMPRERTLEQIDRDVRFFKAAGVKRFIGVDGLIRDRFENNDVPAFEHTRSESEFLLDCLANDGFKWSDSEHSDLLRISDTELQSIRQRINTSESSTLVAVAPGSKRSSRMWNENRFADVLARLSKSNSIFPVFFGSLSERERCDRIMNSCGVGENFAGKLSIRESAALLKSCSFYLGNDTGTMHLAAAVGTRCVAIFSAADRNGQWEPFGSGHKLFRRHVECEGCRVDVCPRENLCLDMVETDEVFDACLAMIEDNKTRK